MTPLQPSFSDIAENFDVFLLDAYGVFNFGSAISTAATDVMAGIIAAGKKLVVVSNATYTSADAIRRYHDKGVVQNVHYNDIVTSGQFAYEDIQRGQLPVAGKKVFVFGTANFKKPDNIVPAIFADSAYDIVDDIVDADFVYCGIPQIGGEDRIDIADFMPAIADIKKHNKTLVCANPDLRALEQGAFVVRQGLVCAAYEETGGTVVYYGKPDPRIFARALQPLGDIDLSKVLMVGDTLRTDILGANRAGIRSCLLLEQGVTGNALQERGMAVTNENVATLIAESGATPDFICHRLPEQALF